MKKVVILDFDDTLVATIQTRGVCIIEGMAFFGKQVTQSQIEELWGTPFRDMILKLNPDINFDSFYKHYQQVMSLHPPKPHKGASELLNHLQKLEIPVMIVSSSSTPLIEQDLLALNFINSVAKIWGHEDTGYCKPDPRVLETVLLFVHDTLGIVSTKNIGYIGDSLHDWNVAKGNNLEFWAVTTGKTNKLKFMEAELSENNIMENLSNLIFTNSTFREWLSI